jgi:hypothetical protein
MQKIASHIAVFLIQTITSIHFFWMKYEIAAKIHVMESGNHFDFNTKFCQYGIFTLMTS